MTKPTKSRKVKAWIITDGKDVPLDFGSIGSSPTKRLFFIYSTKEEAERNWNGMHIYPCEITYKIN